MSNAPVDLDRTPAPRWRVFLSQTWVRLVLLALVYTLLNAFKPVLIDDTAYILYARQIAQHPDDPYGFSYVWYFTVEEANHILAPPVFLYWLGLGMALFGNNPLLWKLWLFPICLLFVAGVQRLAQRVAADCAWPLTLLIVFSPVFLPGLNLMLDVPALALGLTALNVFMAALERDSEWRAVAAGLLVALAMQTKYTAVTIPAVMVLWTLVRLRPWPDGTHLLLAGVTAIVVFVGWEHYTALLYGESHFWHTYSESRGVDQTEHRQRIGPALLSLMGSVSPALLLLGLAGLGATRRWLWIAGAVLIGGFVFLAGWRFSFTAEMMPSEQVFGPQAVIRQWPFVLSEVIFGVYGIVLWFVVIAALWTTARAPAESTWARYRIDVFLTLWVLLEIGGFFVLTPFPAVRRVMGVFLVFCLVLGRLASLTCRAPEQRRLVWGVVGYGLALGLFYQTTDWLQMRLQERAVAEAHAYIEERRADPVPQADGLPGQSVPGGTVWYVGHWGFKFYAERAGMKEVILPYQAYDSRIVFPEESVLRKGDWLVIPDDRIFQPGVKRRQAEWEAKPPPLVEIGHLSLNDGWPLRTILCYYGGSVGMDHSEGRTRIEVKIYRVTEDFAPQHGEDGFPHH